MSTVVAGALAVTPLYATSADAIVSWDDPGATWRSLGTIPVGGGTVTSIAAGVGITVSPSPIVGAGTVSLTVPVGVANGGTGTSTVFTAGSVLFAGAAGVHAQDNANLFWDDGANRLGVGTALPLGRLQITGVARVGGEPTYRGDVIVDLTASDGTAGGIELKSDQSGAGYGSRITNYYDGTGYSLVFQNRNNIAGWTTRMAVGAVTGNVGIATTNPGFTLDVNGSLGFSGHIFATWNASQSVVYDGSGNIAFALQSAFNAYRGTQHNFLNAAATVNWAIINTSGTANISGAWTVISAREMKQEIAPYTRGLDALVQLQPRVFRYRAGTPFAREDGASEPQIGLIADEVEPYLPELVGEMTTTDKGDREVTVAILTPHNALYAVINSIKTLAEQNAALAARIEALEAA